jgi:hypothetical protein
VMTIGVSLHAEFIATQILWQTCPM